MKKLLVLIPSLCLLAACSSSPKSASRLNCERLHADSLAKVMELQKVFVVYQEINYDLALKLSPAFKTEVDELNVRIRKQKQKCWKGDEKPIDAEMALLKDETMKVYGEVSPKEVRIPAAVVAPAVVPAEPELPHQFAPAPENEKGPASASEALGAEEQK